MSERSSTEGPDGDYEAAAEYYDLASIERAEVLDAVIGRWAADLPTGPVVDVGAGSGRLTTTLARSVPSVPVYAIEPDPALRALLTARLVADVDLLARVDVIPDGIPGAWGMVPDRLAGAIVLGVLPHLPPDGRTDLLARLAERLEPRGTALVEVMPPWSADPIPQQEFVSAAAGSQRVVGEMRADPEGDDILRWKMTYRRLDSAGAPLHETTSSFRCWVVHPDRFETEADAAGFVVSWITDQVAQLAPR
ncbi:MAG: class I SAM-dependent methyltransferase [Actinomycetota bacterium]